MKNNILKLEMFEAVCKGGHVGRGWYRPIHFPIIAESRKDAARIARDMPRVKHNHKDAVLNVIKIDFRRYKELKRENDRDKYLHCRNIQDQNLIDIDDQLIEEKKPNIYPIHKDESDQSFYCGKRQLRNPKKFMTRYYDFENCIDINNIAEYNDIA